jgi:hypothetical protein
MFAIALLRDIVTEEMNLVKELQGWQLVISSVSNQISARCQRKKS